MMHYFSFIYYFVSPVYMYKCIFQPFITYPGELALFNISEYCVLWNVKPLITRGHLKIGKNSPLKNAWLMMKVDRGRIMVYTSFNIILFHNLKFACILYPCGYHTFWYHATNMLLHSIQCHTSHSLTR